jgi:cob(I)alamin adenosyltransferase
MVLLTRIYTKGGDKGKTSLGSGKRVSKASKRIHAIGDVDEANACIGLARLYAKGELNDLLSHIQNDLFDVGADLCVPQEKNEKDKLRIHASQVDYLEKKIDMYNESLSPLTSFVLPAGSNLSSYLHFARTVVRRAERMVCSIAEEETLNPEVLHYLNRLSDLLFVLARVGNANEKGDILWVPGAHR